MNLKVLVPFQLFAVVNIEDVPLVGGKKAAGELLPRSNMRSI